MIDYLAEDCDELEERDKLLEDALLRAREVPTLTSELDGSDKYAKAWLRLVGGTLGWEDGARTLVKAPR